MKMLTTLLLRRRSFWLAAIFSSPLVILGWMIFGPFTLGNDYQVYQVAFAQLFRFYSRLGILPTWYPHLEGGVPFGSFTMAQEFHFPAWFISQFSSFWSGDALLLITLKHLAILCFGQACTFFFLRDSLRQVPRWAIFLFSVVVLYNMRSLDALRYGTYLDAMIFAHCLCLAFVSYLKSGRLIFVFAITILSQLLFTAGYDTLAIFAAMVILTTWLYWTLSRRLTRSQFFSRSGWALSAALIGFGLSAPHWAPFLDALQVNYTRFQHPTLEWANKYALDASGVFPHNFKSICYNLITPWLAEVHSAFSGTGLLSIVLMTTGIQLLFTFRRNWILTLGFIFPFLYAVGLHGPFFEFFFRHVPGFNSFRIPGRIFAVLPSLLTIVASECFETSRSTMLPSFRLRKGSFRTAAAILLFGSIAMLFRVYRNDLCADGTITPILINPEAWGFHSRAAWLWLNIALSSLVLLLSCYGDLAVVSQRLKVVRLAAISGVFLIAFFQCFYIMRNGSWVAPAEGSSTFAAFSKADHLPLYSRSPLIAVHEIVSGSWGAETPQMANFVKFTNGAARCFFPFGPTLDKKVPVHAYLPWYLTDQVRCVDSFSQPPSWDVQKVCDSSPFVVVSAPSDLCARQSTFHPRIKKAFEQIISLNSQTKLTVLTPNAFEFEVTTDTPSVFSTSIPAVQNWFGKVDSSTAPIIETNGGLIGLAIPAGHHRIRLQYYPDIYWKAQFLVVISIVFLMIVLLELNSRASVNGVRKYRHLFYFVVLVLIFGFVPKVLETSTRQQSEKNILLNNSYQSDLENQIKIWRALAHSGEKVSAKSASP